jgi:hypothetical protein
MEQFIRNYIIERAKTKQLSFSVWNVQWINYLSNFLHNMTRVDNKWKTENIISHPYYNYWASRWNYKNAWDACTFKYLFWKDSILSEYDYLKLALTWYAQYFWREDIVEWISNILPIINNFTRSNAELPFKPQLVK